MSPVAIGAAAIDTAAAPAPNSGAMLVSPSRQNDDGSDIW
jgi:hypothetical protein